MKKIVLSVLSVSFLLIASAQPDNPKNKTITPPPPEEKILAATPVKNQAMTGTCWCFGTTSLVESQCIKNNLGENDLSEMFVVRNIYIEKAKNYILRQGHAQFGEGGLGHDMIRATAVYGALPESSYSGLLPGNKMHNHQKMAAGLKTYLDSIVKIVPAPKNWLEGYVRILNDHMGVPPEKITVEGREMSPQIYARKMLQFNAEDYVNITSFTHQPYYKPFVLQVPDNFSNGAYYNLPLNEMTALVKNAIQNGFTVLWDADVSNTGFRQDMGYALFLKEGKTYSKEEFVPNTPERSYDENIRQDLYENLTTQDDHLMHIVGIEKSKDGKAFFIVKNSWGLIGPFKGYIKVSEAYFAINTISLVVPKGAFSADQLNNLGIK